MYRHPVISAFVLATVFALPVGPVPQAIAAQATTPAAASPVTTGNFSGLVDIGGRSLYLECRGQGGPTVILEAGAFGRGDVWSRDNLHPVGARTMVLPGVAAFTRVCAYDRPGTLGEVNPDLDPDGSLSSSPAAATGSPAVYRHAGRGRRPTRIIARRLYPGPDVLVAHSAGGLVVRLYASTYPDEVVGMVLLDSTHEDVWLRFQEALPPAQWPTLKAFTSHNQPMLDAYPDAEERDTAPLKNDATTGQVRQAVGGTHRCARRRSSFSPTAFPLTRRSRLRDRRRWEGIMTGRCRTIG